MRLTNRVALVTGAASGIGKEIARAFLREGAKVAIADLNQAGADAAAAELGGPDRRAIGVAMDVTSEQQVEAGMARTVKTFGRIDILVSNAGIQIVAPLDEFEFAQWKQMLAIHLDGAFLTTRAALRRMYQQGRRQHHLHGLGPFQGSLAAQGALRDGQARPRRARQGRRQGRCEARRARQRHLSRLRAHAAGRTSRFPSRRRSSASPKRRWSRHIMLKDTVDGEFTTVEDVAEAALFFAAFQSNALTGQSLVVSHGWFMQ